MSRMTLVQMVASSFDYHTNFYAITRPSRTALKLNAEEITSNPRRRAERQYKYACLSVSQSVKVDLSSA